MVGHKSEAYTKVTMRTIDEISSKPTFTDETVKGPMKTHISMVSKPHPPQAGEEWRRVQAVPPFRTRLGTRNGFQLGHRCSCSAEETPLPEYMPP